MNLMCPICLRYVCTLKCPEYSGSMSTVELSHSRFKTVDKKIRICETSVNSNTPTKSTTHTVASKKKGDICVSHQ